MTVQHRRTLLLCGLLPALVVALLSLYRPTFLENQEFGAYDTLVRHARTRPPSGRIAIVDVDEHSLAAVGQWPWRRDVVGQLIGRIRELGASTIALDIVFAESDRYAGEALTDEAMASALRPGRVVLGYALTFDSPATPTSTSACVQHPLGLAVIRRDDERASDPFFQASGVVCRLPLRTRAAGASGFLNAAPDPDGLLRRVPLLVAFNGQVYPGLALAAVLAARKTRDVSLRVINVNTASLALDKESVLLDGKSNLLLRYRGAKRTFPYVSAADVLS